MSGKNSEAEGASAGRPCNNEDDKEQGSRSSNEDQKALLAAHPPCIALLNLFHLVCIFLELFSKQTHLLGALHKIFAFSEVIDLFLSRTLCHFFDLFDLVLGLRDRSHLDARVVVVVDSTEVSAELLVENVWFQVILHLHESEVVCIMSSDGLVHLVKEALCTFRTIAHCCDKADENDIEHDVALERSAARHGLDANLSVAIARVFRDCFQSRGDPNSLIRELLLIQLTVHQLFKYNHIAVSRDKAVVHS